MLGAALMIIFGYKCCIYIQEYTVSNIIFYKLSLFKFKLHLSKDNYYTAHTYIIYKFHRKMIIQVHFNVDFLEKKSIGT